MMSFRLLLTRLSALLAVLILPRAAAAADCVAPPVDPAYTYNAQHTYDKLRRAYPAIRIADAVLPPTVRLDAGLIYAQSGSRCLQLDLYRPRTAASEAASDYAAAPVVLLVHGGGWRAGDRTEFAPMAVRLAQRGYAAITVSYRLSGEALYPAAIDDVRAALRWLRAHAADYQLDPQRIALAGGSAGGQIASLVGVTGGLADRSNIGELAPDVDVAVQAVVNIDGLSDFTSALALTYEDDPAKQPSAAGAWFGGRYAQRSALWQAASPIRYVRPGMPPLLFIVSAQPRFSAGREAMAAAMAALGVTSQTVALSDTPHAFWLFDPWLEPTVEATVAFLQQQMPARQRSVHRQH